MHFNVNSAGHLLTVNTLGLGKTEKMGNDARKRRKGLQAVKLILALVILLFIASFLILRMMLGRTSYVGDDQMLMTEVLETESEAPPTAEEMYHPEEVVPVSQERTEGTWTLLVIGEGRGVSDETDLFGTDLTEAAVETEQDAAAEPAGETKFGDAQAIILMTINHNTKEVYFTTFNPDLYVKIRNFGGHRLGSAYAAGGGPLLEETIEENYGVVIDQFASIRMHDVARIMDMEEFETMDISTEGVDVIENLVFQMSSIGPAKLAGYISELLPYVSHNIESSKVMGILLQVPRVVNYVSIKSVLPYNGMYQQLEGYLVPDIGPTAEHLQNVIYGPAEAETEISTDSVHNANN